MGAPDTVVDVSGWIPEDAETLGAREKVWIRDGEGPAAAWWLFKRPRASGLPELGADLWAEVLASQVAGMLPLPAAEARFALWDGAPGVISRRVGETLIHGNELLSSRDAGYQRDRLGHVPGYDLGAIGAVLSGYAGSEPGMTAFDSFAGYLVFDALIGNTDRHHENWAVLEPSHALAPSYDHGASLGFNVRLDRRLDVEAVAERGHARHFPGRPSLVALARQALERVDGPVRERWLARVEGLNLDAVRDVTAGIPGGWMSEGARTFVVDFIAANRGRLTQ
jgi:hypothetical protein